MRNEESTLPYSRLLQSLHLVLVSKCLLSYELALHQSTSYLLVTRVRKELQSCTVLYCIPAAAIVNYDLFADPLTGDTKTSTCRNYKFMQTFNS